MKTFFKYMFASMLGLFLSLLLLLVIFIITISAIAASMEKEKTVKVSSNSILEIKLDDPVTERTPSNPFKNFNFFSFKSHTQPGIYDIVKCIDKAAKDENMKGIYLNVSNVRSGLANIEEIRNALLRFKNSGKFLIANSEAYEQNTYYLCSVADKIFLNPEGIVDFRGYFTELLFFKDMLSRLEIEPQVIKHGKFKSASEPFTLDKMSDENRLQIKEFVDDLWHHAVQKISESRKITVAELLNIADSMKIQHAADALQYRLIDQLAYEDEVLDMLKQKSGIAKDEKLKLISLNKYKNASLENKDFVKEKIALIYATGAIGSGEGDDEEIGSETLVKEIRKARRDDNVKAIVLRVNSPGGIVLASEVIWREVHLAQQQKPVVVSMGDVAASGGYYISCEADTILAQPNTITGSIGVFGLLFNIKNMLNNKLGITSDLYKTNKFADIGMPTHPLSEAERKIIQNAVERVYNVFTKRVADGRNMLQSSVDSIGQGRVWSGIDAKRIGLIDAYGGLSDAVHLASKMGRLEKYRVLELPEQDDLFKTIIKELKDNTALFFASKSLGKAGEYYKSIQEITDMQGIQARMIFEPVIK